MAASNKPRTVYMALDLKGEVEIATQVPEAETGPESKNWQRIFIFCGTETQADQLLNQDSVVGTQQSEVEESQPVQLLTNQETKYMMPK